MSLIPFAPFFPADFLAPFCALLFPWLGRLLKYWSGSRVEADGLRARSKRGTSPRRAVTRERRRPGLSASRPTGCVAFGRWSALLAGRDRCGYRRCARALTSAKNRQQCGPLQYFNSLLKCPRRPVIGHVLLGGHARNGAANEAIVTPSAPKNRSGAQAMPTSRHA